MTPSEFYENIGTKSSFYKFLGLDKTHNLLIVNYCTLKNEMLKTRSFTDTESNVMVLSKDGSCILDNKIRGFIFAVEEGFIYTLIEESEKYFVIGKYQIVLYSEKL